MSISDAAKEAWTRNLSTIGVSGYVKRVSGFGDVGFVDSTRTGDSLVETDMLSIVAQYDRDEINDTLIQENDLRITSDSSVVLTKKDRLKIGTNTYKIESIREVNFSGTLVGYVTQARL